MSSTTSTILQVTATILNKIHWWRVPYDNSPENQLDCTATIANCQVITINKILDESIVPVEFVWPWCYCFQCTFASPQIFEQLDARTDRDLRRKLLHSSLGDYIDEITSHFHNTIPTHHISCRRKVERMFTGCLALSINSRPTK